jgi:predicted DNA-binding protein YlxM (UPF0122 family)
MIDTEYLTAAEIAQKAGISRQTVYNRIKNEWQPYVREIDGKTYISVKALSNNLTAGFDTLKSAIDDKNREIDRLREDLAAERTRSADLERRLLEYADRFADMAEREQELTRNAQRLHAIAEVRNDPPELPEPETEEPHGFIAWIRRRAGK